MSISPAQFRVLEILEKEPISYVLVVGKLQNRPLKGVNRRTLASLVKANLARLIAGNGNVNMITVRISIKGRLELIRTRMKSDVINR